jgi:regulator of Ty1 transposition protein 109
LVFAIEVFIFTTAHQTILFVSKADSTGCLHLLELPKGSPSPIRQVCATFLAYLLDHRRRKNVQSVVNLFARAQAQYLFPGSVRNKGKHVLNDWGLVRWWCKALNPLMEGLSQESWGSVKGYLVVPGLEELETQSFIPRTTASVANWVIGHPLERISRYTHDFDSVPPRCLIPGYPDDPKTRFRDELDEEVSKQKQGIKVWKSVKSLDQFWEMMAFRQECSSGRLTGFIWLVFDPETSEPRSANRATPHVPFNPRSRSFQLGSPAAPTSPRSQAAKKRAKKKLSGRIIPRAPKIKTHARNYFLDHPTATAYYYWPLEGRGDRIVDQPEYKRIVELLLHLDFSTLDKAVGSSQRWVGEVGVGARLEDDIAGTATATRPLGMNGTATSVAGDKVTNLTGLVRRKNPSHSLGADTDPQSDSVPKVSVGAAADPSRTSQVNVLGANLVRKKKKDVESGDGTGSNGAPVR